jgi:hypothetical protein
MTRNPLIAAIFGMFLMAMRPLYKGASAYRGGTPARRASRNREGLPAGYPGAKLHRKAILGQIGKRHI